VLKKSDTVYSIIHLTNSRSLFYTKKYIVTRMAKKKIRTVSKMNFIAICLIR